MWITATIVLSLETEMTNAARNDQARGLYPSFGGETWDGPRQRRAPLEKTTSPFQFSWGHDRRAKDQIFEPPPAMLLPPPFGRLSSSKIS